jgi:hypothetical protein
MEGAGGLVPPVLPRRGPSRWAGLRRTLTFIWILPCVLAGVSCGGGTGGQPERVTRPVATTDPLRTFAPLVHLQSREDSLPLSATRFLRHSTLEWSGGDCPSEVNVAAGPVSRRITREGAPPLDVDRLGNPPAYSYRPRHANCRDARGRTFKTTQLTRPYDDGHRAVGLDGDEGFNLDVLLAAYPGQRTVVRRRGQSVLKGVPAYGEGRRTQVDGRQGLRLSYWLLFAHTESLMANGDRVSSLEGGWERTDVLVQPTGSGRYLPIALVTHRDGRAVQVPWADLKVARSAGERSATHPELYAARASHALYTRPGRHQRRSRSSYNGNLETAVDSAVSCADCPRWQIWRTLRRVDAEPWYGYGGGWGMRGGTPENSGRLGPYPKGEG